MTVPKSPMRRFMNRGMAFAVVIVFFLVGYNSFTAQEQACSANNTMTVSPPVVALPVVPPVGVACGCMMYNTVPCTIMGSTSLLATGMLSAYEAALQASAMSVENYIGMAVDSLVQTVFSRLEQAELDLADWFDTYWFYNLRPSLQAQTEQQNIADFDQAQQLAAISDAEQQNLTSLEINADEVRAAISQSQTANTDTCAVASSAGGLGRATVFGRALRRAWQGNFMGGALNEEGTPGALGPAAAAAAHAAEFENLFCDPAGNNGNNNCGKSDPQFYNADTQATARIYNTLTIPIHEDPRHNTVVENIMNNMVGRPQMGLIAGDAIATAQGKQTWMDRRSHIARKNAVRAVPSLVSGWRVPGGGSQGFTQALREGAGVQLDSLSDNPSYREIIHAMTVDRFNSGTYAVDKIGTPERQQMEKLILSAMYLTQLRDYYELLERQALTLAVQVGVMADEYPLAEKP